MSPFRVGLGCGEMGCGGKVVEDWVTRRGTAPALVCGVCGMCDAVSGPVWAAPVACMLHQIVITDVLDGKGSSRSAPLPVLD